MIDIAAHDGPQGPIIDAAHCESSFLQANAAGTFDNLTGQATFDLARLTTELAQFIDLTGVQLAGAGKIGITWQRGNDQTFAAQGTVEATDLEIGLGGRPAWVEKQLTGQFEAGGSLAGMGLKQLDKVTVRANAGQDQFTAELTQAVTDLVKQPLPLRVTWQGAVQSWLGRAALWCDVRGWDVSGNGGMTATLACSPRGIAIQECAVAAEQLHVWGQGLFLDEALEPLTWRLARSIFRRRQPPRALQVSSSRPCTVR